MSRIGSLLPAEDARPQYLQLYFYERELEARADVFADLRQDVIQQLQDMLQLENAYVRDLRSVLELLPRERQDIKIVLNERRRPVTEHERLKRLPEAPRAAQPARDWGGGAPHAGRAARRGTISCCIAETAKWSGSANITIATIHSNMRFSHPHGTDGWSLEMKRELDITATEYYAFHLR